MAEQIHFLPAEQFRHVVALAPLVAIDLVVTNAQSQVLLGQRLNRPARGLWFVPGGRIFKNERLDDAFARITQAELGQAWARSGAKLLGVFEHLYDDSVFGAVGEGPSTHYVVLGYQLCVDDFSLNPPRSQHGFYRWQEAADAQTDVSVHLHTRNYMAYIK